MTIPIARKKKAKRLFIIEEKSIIEVSQLTGISDRTIAQWSTKEGWMASRIEYRQTQERIEFNLFNLYEALTKKAAESLDPQSIEQVIQLGKEFKKGEEPLDKDSLGISDRGYSINDNIAIKKASDILPFISYITEKAQEYLLCITLNNANEIIKNRVVTIGLLDKSQGHPREVFADAISDRAARVILAHNHPSGTLNPSPDDINLSYQLVNAGKIIGIEVLDHIIVSKKGYLSMKDKGYF